MSDTEVPDLDLPEGHMCEVCGVAMVRGEDDDWHHAGEEDLAACDELKIDLMGTMDVDKVCDMCGAIMIRSGHDESGPWVHHSPGAANHCAEMYALDLPDENDGSTDMNLAATSMIMARLTERLTSLRIEEKRLAAALREMGMNLVAIADEPANERDDQRS